MSAFSHWLSTPFRAVRASFPFSKQGMATLVYLVFAGCGPTLTLFVWWAMRQLQAANQWQTFASLAEKIAWALLIIVCGIGMFVSIRAVKIGPFEASGFREDDDGKTDAPPPPPAS